MAVGVLNVAGGSTDVAVTARTNVIVMGYSVKETAAGVATATLHNGTSASDPVIANLNLAAAASDHEWFGPQGVMCSNGIWLERLTGSMAVTVYTA